MFRLRFACLFCLCGCLTARAEFRPQEPLCDATSGENRSGTLPEARSEAAAAVVLPTFQGGGIVRFKRWVLSQLSFSTVRYEAEDEAHFAVAFVVDKKGCVKSIEVPKPYQSGFYAEEVMRIIRSSPEWTPRSVDGHAADSPVQLQFDFKLQMAADATGVMIPRIEDITVYKTADTRPSFGDGSPLAFRNWILENLDYKPGKREHLMVNFVVGKDGSTNNYRVTNSKDSLLIAAVHKLCEQAPAWTPGLIEGEPERVKVVQVVTWDAGDNDEDDKQFVLQSEVLYLFDEVMPSFKGGDLETFRLWVMSHINYPQQLRNKNVQGRVLAEFIIEKDGSLSTVKIKESPHPLLSKLICWKLSRSPRWTPGTATDKIFRVKYTLPVIFKIAGCPPNTEAKSSSPDSFPHYRYP